MASMATTTAGASSLLIRRKNTSPFQRRSLPQPLSSSPHGIRASAALVQASPNNKRNVAGFGRTNARFAPPAAVESLIGAVTKTDGLRYAIIVARFNEVVTRLLLEGALETFRRYSVSDEDVDVIWVPGAYEIPVAAERLGKLKKHQAVICIGAVIRGDTTHYESVANSAASGMLSAALSSGVPCILGVLTCENMDQALDRAGGKVGNKGAEAALTATEIASLFEHHLKQ